MSNAMNPTGAEDVAKLPADHVAILVWRRSMGPQPLTIVVTRASWEMNQKVVYEAGNFFDPERIYEFESPVGPTGRKTIFHFQDVVSWAANVDTGIVPANG